MTLHDLIHVVSRFPVTFNFFLTVCPPSCGSPPSRCPDSWAPGPPPRAFCVRLAGDTVEVACVWWYLSLLFHSFRIKSKSALKYSKVSYVRVQWQDKYRICEKKTLIDRTIPHFTHVLLHCGTYRRSGRLKTVSMEQLLDVANPTFVWWHHAKQLCMLHYSFSLGYVPSNEVCVQ